MTWFHPKSLLDKSYEIGLLLKGIDGTIELIGALLLIFVPPHFFESMAHWLTRAELASDPDSFVANHTVHAAHTLAQGHNLFATLFLLTHGAVKVVLVVCLLRNKLWAYPYALIALGLFLAYQLYAMVVKPTLGMGFLTVLDAAIIWLVWREWQKVRAEHANAATGADN